MTLPDTRLALQSGTQMMLHRHAFSLSLWSQATVLLTSHGQPSSHEAASVPGHTSDLPGLWHGSETQRNPSFLASSSLRRLGLENGSAIQNSHWIGCTGDARQLRQMCSTGTNTVKPPSAITDTPSSTVSEPVPKQGLQQRQQERPGFNRTRPAHEPLGDAPQISSSSGSSETSRECNPSAALVSPGGTAASMTPTLARTVPARSRKKAQGLLDAVDNLDQLADILHAATSSSKPGSSISPSNTQSTSSQVTPVTLSKLSNTVPGIGGGIISVDAAALGSSSTPPEPSGRPDIDTPIGFPQPVNGPAAVKWDLLSDPVVMARAAELLTHLLGNINLRVPPEHVKSFHKAVTQKVRLGMDGVGLDSACSWAAWFLVQVRIHM